MRLILALLCLSIVTGAVAQRNTGLKDQRLKGKVRSLKTQDTYRYKKTGVFTEWAKTWSRQYEYDKTGNTTQFQEFDAKGALSYKIQYGYDAKTKKVELAYFDKESKPTTKYVHVYNSKDQKTEELQYKQDGSLRWRYAYVYDAAGNNTEMISYRSGDTLYSTTYWTYDTKGNQLGYLLVTPGYANSSRKYVYDEKGNRTGDSWLNGKGATDFRFERTYDENGNVIKEVKYKKEETTPFDIVTWRYEYDKAGNWTKRTQSTRDGEDFDIEERVITYYQ